jgi:hypothetical protein
MEKTYNGWTNYATWRVNLEVFDGVAWLDQFDDGISIYDASKLLQDYAYQVIFECGECNENSLAGSYALAFLDEVNWHEIAQSMYDNYNQECEV